MHWLKKLLKSTKEFFVKKTKVAIFISAVVLVVFAIGTYAAVEVTSTNKFCISCHEMGPAYHGYLISTHYNVKSGKKKASCRDCHIAPWSNPVNVLWDKAYHGIKDVYHHFADKKDLMKPGYHDTMRSHAPKGIRNANCLKCHKDIYKKTYKDYVNIHVSLKGNKHSRCAECHTGMVHTPYIVKEKKTAKKKK